MKNRKKLYIVLCMSVWLHSDGGIAGKKEKLEEEHAPLTVLQQPPQKERSSWMRNILGGVTLVSAGILGGGLLYHYFLSPPPCSEAQASSWGGGFDPLVPPEYRGTEVYTIHNATLTICKDMFAQMQQKAESYMSNLSSCQNLSLNKSSVIEYFSENAIALIDNLYDVIQTVAFEKEKFLIPIEELLKDVAMKHTLCRSAMQRGRWYTPRLLMHFPEECTPFLKPLIWQRFFEFLMPQNLSVAASPNDTSPEFVFCETTSYLFKCASQKEGVLECVLAEQI